jgi:hypothetical protein
MVPFRDVQFGFASAETERSDFPHLLQAGFVDPFDAVQTLLYSPKFLVLGEKGTGKTAIREHIAMSDDPNVFTTSGDLGAYEFEAIRQAAGMGESEELAWRTLLMLQIVNSFERDVGVVGVNPVAAQDWHALLEHLRMRGLIFANAEAPVAHTSTSRSRVWSLSFWQGFFGLGGERSTSTELEPALVPVLAQKVEHVVLRLTTTSRHLVILDGLDDVLAKGREKLPSIAALLREASRLNNDLRSYEIPAKVIVLCREDVFDALPDPNMNKIAADRAIQLHWSPSGVLLQDSALVQFIQHRTDLASRGTRIADYFPREIENRPSLDWIVSLTRRTPRDLVMLLRGIQTHAAREQTALDRPTIMAGAKTYSEDYLLPEVLDQVQGFITRDQGQRYINLLTTMRRPRFWAKDLAEHAKYQGQTVDDAEACLRALFSAGAIGNAAVRAAGGGDHQTWRFRNRRAQFNVQEEVLVHPGLTKALNMAFDGVSAARRSR